MSYTIKLRETGMFYRIRTCLSHAFRDLNTTTCMEIRTLENLYIYFSPTKLISLPDIIPLGARLDLIPVYLLNQTLHSISALAFIIFYPCVMKSSSLLSCI